MRLGKKKESLLGLIITAVLCLGFLWWWFRPVPQQWQEETAAQLVARAMKEPRPAGRVEQQVLDLDLMEIALGQVRELGREEALAVAQQITDPVIRTLTGRQLAHAWLSSDPQDFGEALEFSILGSDPAEQTALRTHILGMLAAAGFPDAALPEAKTPLQKAILANRITDNDAVARELLAAAETALPSLPAGEAGAVRREIARGRIALCRSDPPAAAIAAIKSLPAEERGELWLELTGLCQGRADRETSVPLVFAQIEDPALRRRMEIESLIFGVKLSPVAQIIADCQAAVNTAASPADKTAAMITLSKAQYESGDAALQAAASGTLQQSAQLAQTIPAAGERCLTLLHVARRFSELAMLPESRAALDQSIAATRAVTDPAVLIPLLVATEEESYKQADEPGAVRLMDQAAQLAEQAPASPDAATVEALASALIRRGHWQRALALVDRIPAGPARLAALKSVATTAAEDFASVDPANPPPRGEPLDTIRREAISDQVRAANLTEARSEGFERARAWLAMAKAVFTPPVSLNDYMAAGTRPGDELPPAAEEDQPVPVKPGEE